MICDELRHSQVAMLGISNINLVMGRNGSGKSRFLRALELGLRPNPAFNVKYVSPERAGVFANDGGIQNAMNSSAFWLSDTRRLNQATNFKAASAELLKEAELIYLRGLQGIDATELSFKRDRLDLINKLLANISIEQEGSKFVFKASSGDIVAPSEISSGESEAIALASEIIYFFDTLDSLKCNVLFLDEPDVHLHPDLQSRMAKLIIGELDRVEDVLRNRVVVCIATHSTPLICAFCASSYTTIGTKDFGVDTVQQLSSSDQLKKIVPFFGHPLSLSLSNDVLLIVEGEDDERVWQQATRSSQGRIRLFPVLSSSIDQQSKLEDFCAPLLSSLYDDPVAYSIRDGDGVQGDLNSIGPIIRFRLTCYAIENAILTDECLAAMETSWGGFRVLAEVWIGKNEMHKDVALIRELIDSNDRLRNKKIKDIRQLVVVIAGKTKPWEVVVGQAIGTLNPSTEPVLQSSLLSYLGPSAVNKLLMPSASLDAPVKGSKLVTSLLEPNASDDALTVAT